MSTSAAPPPTPPPPPPPTAAAAAAVPAHLRDLAESLPLTLTPEAAAQVLQVTARTVRRMVAIGELHAIRSVNAGSARYIIPRSEVLRWMAERSA